MFGAAEYGSWLLVCLVDDAEPAAQCGQNWGWTIPRQFVHGLEHGNVSPERGKQF